MTTESDRPLGLGLSEGLGPNADTVERDPTHACTLAQRCELAEKCLPVSRFRAQVERLHADMLAEIERLRLLTFCGCGDGFTPHDPGTCGACVAGMTCRPGA